MGSGNIKWHVHCSVCGAFLEKSAQSDSEVDCKNAGVHWKFWSKMILSLSVLWSSGMNS